MAEAGKLAVVQTGEVNCLDLYHFRCDVVEHDCRTQRMTGCCPGLCPGSLHSIGLGNRRVVNRDKKLLEREVLPWEEGLVILSVL